MIVFDSHLVLFGKVRKGAFGLKRVFCLRRCLLVDVVKSRGLVDKNSGNGVTTFHKCAGALGNQAGSLGDQLINGNNVTWFRGSSTDVTGRAASTPRGTLGFAKKAACTFGYMAIRKPIG
jgi:hypothetical protein